VNHPARLKHCRERRTASRSLARFSRVKGIKNLLEKVRGESVSGLCLWRKLPIGESTLPLYLHIAEDISEISVFMYTNNSNDASPIVGTSYGPSIGESGPSGRESKISGCESEPSGSESNIYGRELESSVREYEPSGREFELSGKTCSSGDLDNYGL
jgi:hypothetical protein